LYPALGKKLASGKYDDISLYLKAIMNNNDKLGHGFKY
jgi:hypothetical protein